MWYLKFNLITVMLLFSACSKTPELPEPIALDNNNSVALKSNIVDTKKLIIHSQSDTPKKDRELIYQAYSYLLKTYGKPLYQGEVTVEVKKDPIDHPKVLWNIETKEKRRLILGSFHMYSSELPTIIHEMFHALYQDSAFMETYPEFIIEGMASYVEYFYKYKTDAKARAKLTNILKSDKVCSGFKEDFDFNDPFGKYVAKTVYYLYISSGDFFLNQNRNPKELIMQMLNTKYSNKKSISEIIEYFKLSYAPCGFKEQQDKKIKVTTAINAKIMD